MCIPKAAVEIRQCLYTEIALPPNFQLHSELLYTPTFGEQQPERVSWLVSTLAVLQRKCQLVSF